MKKLLLSMLVMMLSLNIAYADIEEWTEGNKIDVYALFQSTDWLEYVEYLNVSVQKQKVAKTQNIPRTIYDKYSSYVDTALAECTYTSRYEKEEYKPIIMAIIAALEANYLPVEGEEIDPNGSANFYSMHYFGPSYKMGEDTEANIKMAINNILYRFFTAEQTQVDGLPPVNIYEMNSSLKRALESVMLDNGFMKFLIEEGENEYTIAKAEQYAIRYTFEGHKIAGFAESVAYRYFCSGPSIGAGGTVVERAESCLGLPYQWGATGPNSFDCSGLVGYALTGTYDRIGTTYTYMTYPKVSDPQPGDICTNDHHCGIYIGDGNMIHAPQTGDVVKIGPVHSDMIFVRYPN